MRWRWLLVLGFVPACGMDSMSAMVPAVSGYAEGQEIRFIHTEASDPMVAHMLTNMMGSPVLVVPELAAAPPSMLAKVFAFTNGLQGGGPMGFQPDVFGDPPGTPGYRPLRALVKVTWKSGQAPRLLRSTADIQAAEARGELMLEQTSVVVNMPMLTWPGGQR